jgi:FkbM family methyltransferase
MQRRLDLWELLLVCGFSAFLGWGFARGSFSLRADLNESRRAEERETLKRRYGPDRRSQFEEEWIVRDFFRDKREGVFVDVGASHHEYFSNTWYLEKRLGWSGVAVDALAQFGDGYRQHRPRTRFFAFFVSDRSDEQARLFVLEDIPVVSSASPEFTRQWGDAINEVAVRTITLDDLLDGQSITSFDFLSMDIELAEPKALAGLDIERFRPALVCVEGHHEVRQQVLDYFARHGYVLLGRYLRVDEQNLWFTPVDKMPPPPDAAR